MKLAEYQLAEIREATYRVSGMYDPPDFFSIAINLRFSKKQAAEADEILTARAVRARGGI